MCYGDNGAEIIALFDLLHKDYTYIPFSQIIHLDVFNYEP